MFFIPASFQPTFFQNNNYFFLYYLWMAIHIHLVLSRVRVRTFIYYKPALPARFHYTKKAQELMFPC